jgi:acyl-CoA dehydrogenase
VGFKAAMKACGLRIHTSAVATGLCDRLIRGTRYALQRKRLANRSRISSWCRPLADSATEALACRAMVEGLQDEVRWPQRLVGRPAVSTTTETVGRIADRMLQIHGGYGYIKAYPVTAVPGRAHPAYLRRASQIMQLVIAKQLLKAAQH